MEDSVPSMLRETLLSPVFLSCFSFSLSQQCYILHFPVEVGWGELSRQLQDISPVFARYAGCLGFRGRQMVSAADFLALPHLLLDG